MLKFNQKELDRNQDEFWENYRNSVSVIDKEVQFIPVKYHGKLPVARERE